MKTLIESLDWLNASIATQRGELCELINMLTSNGYTPNGADYSKVNRNDVTRYYFKRAGLTATITKIGSEWELIK